MDTPKKILILTYWSYPDALIQTYTLPYARIMLRTLPAGSTITLVTLDKITTLTEPAPEKGMRFISLPYVPFGGKAMLHWTRYIIRLYRLIKKENIDAIHCWCTPAGMIGYILSMMSRKPLVIDSYEPHAESMVENGEWKKDSLAFRLLFRFEKLQTNKAQALIATTEGMKVYAKEKYGYSGERFFVKPACVDLLRFSPSMRKNAALLEKFQLENKIVCVYAGKFGGIYLKEEAFDFFKACEDLWGDRFRLLLLSPHPGSEIEYMRIKAGLNKATILHRFVPHAEIPAYIGLGDFAITPVKPVPSKRFCSPIKDGEYWAMGLPVVITDGISDDSEIIEKNGIGAVLKTLDRNAYEKAAREIDQLLKSAAAAGLSEKIRKIAEQYRSYQLAEEVYKKIYS